MHNQIPQPDRSVDNTTIWAPDFNQTLLPEPALQQAPGALDGELLPRAVVGPRTRSTATSRLGPGALQRGALRPQLLRQHRLHARRLGASSRTRPTPGGRSSSPARAASPRLNAFLAQFDVWDRYDYDGDGNFNEPDGYIDHFQSIHAGEGEETGGGAQGTDAIWSHRWYAYYPGARPDGDGPQPARRRPDRRQQLLDRRLHRSSPRTAASACSRMSSATTLACPMSTTRAATPAAENGTGLVDDHVAGLLRHAGRHRLGSAPRHMSTPGTSSSSAGWTTTTSRRKEDRRSFNIGPAESNTKQTQAIVHVLPDKAVDRHLGAPFAGARFYFSGSGNNLDNTMTKADHLGSGPITCRSRRNYQIETVLGLRVPAGLDRRRHDVHHVHTSASTTGTRTARTSARHHRRLGHSVVCDDIRRHRSGSMSRPT